MANEVTKAGPRLPMPAGSPRRCRPMARAGASDLSQRAKRREHHPAARLLPRPHLEIMKKPVNIVPNWSTKLVA
jgi:hypothetical protein